MTKACFRKEMSKGVKSLVEFALAIPKFIIGFIILVIPIIVFIVGIVLHLTTDENIVILWICLCLIEFIWAIIIGFPFITCYIDPSDVVESPKVESAEK